MTDLQCAARIVLVPWAEREPDPPGALADGLRGDRVARVYAAAHAGAVRTAQAVATRLGVDLVVREGLGGAPGDGPEPVAGLGEELQAVADLHRGETVLVVGHGGHLARALPELALSLVPGGPSRLAGCRYVQLDVDGDGWVVRDLDDR